MRLKRLLDATLAAFGLLVLLPLLIIVGILIKLDSPGPVFFRQRRVGLHGRPFHVLKFRTMVVGAYAMGSRLTTKHDPRVTRLGQILRWFKIDELPQLMNVLKGEMSLIGPRPEDPFFVQYYSDEQREVLTVRPGMLGPSQILGRDELESYPEGLQDTEAHYIQHILPDKLARDLEYVRSATLLSDLQLLLRGSWATLLGSIKVNYLWRRRRRIALMGADLGLIMTAWCAAVLIRYDGDWPAADFALPPLLILIAARPASLLYYGAYQGIPAYFGLWDLVALVKAVSVSAVAAAGLTFFAGLQKFPRSVFAIDWALVLFLLGGLRYALRGWVKRKARRQRGRRQRAVIVGAGPSGEQIARTLLEDPLSPYRPVAFIDDMPERWGALIHGVRVVGGPPDLPLALSTNEVKTVFVCISDLCEATTRDIVDICERAGAEYRIVPGLRDLLNPEIFKRNGNEAKRRERDAATD